MMQKILRAPATALLAVTALAVWPILRAGYPFIGDGPNHFYRLVEFDHLLRNGVWFPRWAADLCYGYGCPLFNFYPPLTYYAGAAFHALGLNYAHSLLAVYALAVALAISGAFALAREIWQHEAAALFAATAYGLAPYLYFNALARGALPELLGLGLLPWTLWAYGRLARRPAIGTLLVASLTYAALILSHLLSALLAAPLMFAFALLAWLHLVIPSLRHSVIRHWSLVISAFCLSLALSAYFLLPAVLETTAIKISQLTTPGDLDFHNNFLQLHQLLAWPQTFDARLVFIPIPPSLNLAALALAVMGVAVRFRRPSLWDLGFGIWVLFLLFGLFTLPFTQPFWELLPIANLIQFPWRLVGPASLMLALLAASAFLNLESWNLNLGRWSLGLGIFALWLFSLTWTFAPLWSVPAAPSLRDITSHEAATGQLGTTSAGEFLPLTVQALPAPPTSEVTNRLGPLPEGVTLIEQSAAVASASATINAAAPATLTFNIFYFPGWQATVDGAPAPITPSEPHGLITVPVSAGPHTVAARFGSTPLRNTAALISLAALAIAFTLLVMGRRPLRLAPWPLNLEPFPFHLVTLSAIALLGVRLVLIDGRETVFARTRFDGATVSGVERPLDVNFDNQLILLGADGLSPSLAADNHLPLTLYWRAQNPPAADYAAAVQVVDALGNIFGQSDSQHPGRLPTTRWRSDQYAQDEHPLSLLPGTPPGTYTVTVSVYQPGGSGLSMLDENQIPQGQTFALGTLTVTRATRPPETLDAAQTFNLPLGPLTLIGATLNTSAPQAGDEVRATLFWLTQGDTRVGSTLRLDLITSDGRTVYTIDIPKDNYPWSNGGDVVREPLRFRLPANAPAGPAQLRVQIIGPGGAPTTDPQPIATLDVQVPLRSFLVPAIPHPREDDFGSSIKLLGYDFTPEGLTLYWQAAAEMDTSYTAFVHALNAEGRVIAQSDTVPMNGARPTTGWLTGEVIIDLHTLTLAGAAQIEIGLYDPQTNARLGVIVIAP